MRADPRSVARWAGGAAVALVFAAYYWLFVFPPRLLGAHDPDRYYHLALARLVARDGLVRTLPQVEDLGWGRYFPDKEYLFHLLAGAADRLGGPDAVPWLVPLLGVAIAVLLYVELSRRIRPAHAALVATLVPLGTAAFMFRMTLLRPHLLAMLCFCALLAAILRGRPRLVAVAAALFALSYHGFYIVGFVAAVAWLLRDRPGFRGLHLWAWCLGGLVLGIVLNPYFPSNVSMGLLTLKLALGVDALPGVDPGREMAALPWKRLLLSYGFLPAAIVAAVVAVRVRRPVAGEATAQFWFRVLVSGGFWLLGVRTPRAMEYAIPAGVLMVGYAAWVLDWRGWLPLVAALLVATQGYVAWLQHGENWRYATRGGYEDTAALLAHVPPGSKVFNCDWAAGGYILHARPDLRFVDALDPTLLRDADPGKFVVRQGLLAGAYPDPRAPLRKVFRADYVLCATPALIRQMDALPRDFTTLRGTQGERLRLFAVRPD
jgi:hypothetical protein